MEIIFWISLLLLTYIYWGYRWLLELMVFLKSSARVPVSAAVVLPDVTIVVTVFNESHRIVSRIDNILQCDYPKERLHVIIASDGSTDGTDDLVNAYADERVRLFRTEGRIGKSLTQNAAVCLASDEILVFTDSGSSFDRLFLKEIVKPFEDENVGAVDSHVVFRQSQDSLISESQGMYWRYELALRKLESQLGILAVSSGAGLAIRRQLFRPMEAHYGEDCILPLDVLLKGFKVLHSSKAIVYEEMDEEPKHEFLTRHRMTVRNWQATWARPALLNPLKHPSYALSLWSHKILRWMSPLFLIMLTISASFLAWQGSLFFQLIFAGLVIFYSFGCIGWFAASRNIRINVASQVFSFLLVNTAFFFGLLSCLRGHRIRAYR